MASKPRSLSSSFDESMLSSNVDPDKIFQEQNIDQIKDLLRSLQHESDRKREELRSLVGERYRDLMEASETIISMRNTSNESVNQIKVVQEATLAVSKMNQNIVLSKKNDSEFEDEAQYALAAQIKLLMDIPERIWTSVDSQQYLNATKMYLFARHIHTNLSLNDEIMNSYPVIERQWAAISHFYDSMCLGCDQVLGSGESNTLETLDAMTALTLLKGAKPKTMFDNLLKKRKNDLQSQLKRQDLSAKAHILYSLAAISTFLETVHVCFYQKSLQDRLTKISQDEQILLSASESPVMNFLPSIVRDFKIMMPDEANNENDVLDQAYISKECKTWLDEVHEILTHETSIILSHVHNIVGLSNIRKSVHASLSTNDSNIQAWSQVCQEVLNHSLNLWNEYYVNLFRDRIEAIINTYVAGSLAYLQKSLVQLTNDCSVIDYMMSESGLNEAKGHELLTLKSRSFTPKVQEICQAFNDILEATLNDLKQYVNNSEKEEENSSNQHNFDFLTSDENRNETKEPFALDSDNEFILKCVQKCISSNMEDFLQFLRKSSSNQHSPIVTGRLLQALPDLCPALKTCILAPKVLNKPKDDFMYNHTPLKASKVDPEWQTLKSKLDQEAETMFNLWIDQVIITFGQDLTEGLVNSPENNLANIPTWDSIEISEEGEDGSIKSIIKVPQHLSVNAFKALRNFCQITSQIGPHSLPVKIQLTLSQKAGLAFCKAYKGFCHFNAKMTQNLALQLYFDLQFVSQSMISRESADLQNLAKEAMSELEAHIDPFDLSVFSPYMSNHAKRAVLRHQALFSVLVPSDRYSLLASMKSTLPNSSNISSIQNGHDQHEHNVIPLSATCTRFSLLPITNKRGRDGTRMGGNRSVNSNTLTASNLPTSTSARTSTTSASTKKRSRSPVTTAANSFFEAMSTSWFGGK